MQLLTEPNKHLQMVKSLIGPRTKLVSLVHVSNMLGAILPAEEVVAAAQKARACLQCLETQSASQEVQSRSPFMS